MSKENATNAAPVDGIVIHDSMTVGDLIEQLKQYDSRQRFLVQAILPDGTAWNAPAKVFEVPSSNCGDGLRYLGLQIRCESSGQQPMRPQTMIVGHSTWIDRREQEPDTSKRILVWFRNTVFVGEYIEGRWYEFTDDETLDYLNANYMYPGCLKLDFRYWMPCPEPPEMKE